MFCTCLLCKLLVMVGCHLFKERYENVWTSNAEAATVKQKDPQECKWWGFLERPPRFSGKDSVVGKHLLAGCVAWQPEPACACAVRPAAGETGVFRVYCFPVLLLFIHPGALRCFSSSWKAVRLLDGASPLFLIYVPVQPWFGDSGLSAVAHDHLRNQTILSFKKLPLSLPPPHLFHRLSPSQGLSLVCCAG